jgi:hypothetical protein
MQLPSHGVANEVSIPADGRRLILIRTGRGQHYFGWNWNQNTAAIVVPVAHKEKRAACKRKRPKSREETPKEGSDSLATAALYV